jgi:hypothetical protein
VGVWRVWKAIVTGFAGTTCRHVRQVSLRRLCLTIVLAAITLSLPRLAAQRVTVGVVSAKGDEARAGAGRVGLGEAGNGNNSNSNNQNTEAADHAETTRISQKALLAYPCCFCGDPWSPCSGCLRA